MFLMVTNDWPRLDSNVPFISMTGTLCWARPIRRSFLWVRTNMALNIMSTLFL